MTTKDDIERTWLKVLGPEELPDGRVKTVSCAHRTLCMTHHEGQYAALDNKCPHQGGPLGEGSIEGGWLRCPWHGWDFHPLTGKPPGGYDDGVDTFPIEEREDGIYVGFPAEEEHEPTVSDVMAETMVNWGVEWVFGMVGHSNLGLADAIRRQTKAGQMRYVGIRHEGAASFACSAYGKLTGLWDANVDRAPVLALTGQVQTQVLGRGAFQEVDLKAAFGQVAQWAQTVLHHSAHAELVNLAVKTATLNRGVSHLIFPDEVQVLPAGEAKAGKPDGRIASRAIAPPKESLDAALAKLNAAKRPAIIVGHGAREGMADVVALAEALNCPVLTTFKAKGLIGDQHPLAAGVLGRSGTPVASWFMNESDLLLVFGASFSNHTGITPKKPIVQVDFDPLALGRVHAVSVPVLGDIAVTATALREGLTGDAVDQRGEIAERWGIWRAEKAKRRKETRGEGISSAVIFEALTQAIPGDAIIAVDVGNNTYSFGRYFECTEQPILMSGYLGSIGFSFPAAIGAWCATQEKDTPFAGRKVVSVSGDGGFGQYLAELNTAVKYKMNITHVLLHNGELGKISKEQLAGDWDVWETSLSNPNFAEYASLGGAFGQRVTDASELGEALRKALAHDGPALVEVMADAKLI